MSFRAAAYGLAQRTRGRDYHRPFGAIKEMMRDPSLQERSQSQLLQALLLHAYDSAPHYRPLFEKCGLMSDGELDMRRFEEVPLLTREIIRGNLGRLVSREGSSRRPYWFDTSGSTGEPLRFLLDNVYDSWVIATWEYYCRQMLGIDYRRSKKLIFCTPSREIPRGPRRTLRYWFTNEIHVSSLRLSDDDLYSIASSLNSHRPDLVIGFPSLIFELSRFIDKKGMHVSRPKCILTNSESLEDVVREAIERAFDSRVYDTYGSNEASGIAGECKEGVKHVFTFMNHLELLKSSGSGDGGEVVVTPLHNFTMPLVRYSVGDVAFRGPAECKCGSPLPTLGRVIGRKMSFLVNEAGDLVFGLSFIPFFRLNRAIRAFKIVQEEYKKVRISVVLDRVDRPWQERVEHVIKLTLGSDCSIIWEFVDEIPPSPSGKHLWCYSLLHRQ